MPDSNTHNDEMIDFIDAWLGDNAYRLDSRVLDFVLDVRLLATGASGDPVPDAPNWVAALVGV